MSRNNYTPVRNGFVQDTYADQMESAYAGMLANASDINLCDSYIAGDTADPNGLLAGIGVVETESTDPTRPGVNEQIANYPAAGAAVADFAGITIRSEQMGTNADGNPCKFAGEMINVLRSKRVGGRPWVMLTNGATSFGGTAYWIISDTTGHGHQVGSFSAVALGVDTVQLTNVKFKGMFVAPADGFVPAKVEIFAA